MGNGNENRKPTHGVCEMVELKMRGGSGKKEKLEERGERWERRGCFGFRSFLLDTQEVEQSTSTPPPSSAGLYYT